STLCTYTPLFRSCSLTPHSSVCAKLMISAAQPDPRSSRHIFAHSLSLSLSVSLSLSLIHTHTHTHHWYSGGIIGRKLRIQTDIPPAPSHLALPSHSLFFLAFAL